MSYPFIFDDEQAIEAILYIAQNVKEPTFHRISKVMYFADKAPERTIWRIHLW
jgi:hypothetical protein